MYDSPRRKDEVNDPRRRKQLNDPPWRMPGSIDRSWRKQPELFDKVEHQEMNRHVSDPYVEFGQGPRDRSPPPIQWVTGTRSLQRITFRNTKWTNPYALEGSQQEPQSLPSDISTRRMMPRDGLKMRPSIDLYRPPSYAKDAHRTQETQRVRLGTALSDAAGPLGGPLSRLKWYPLWTRLGPAFEPLSARF